MRTTCSPATSRPRARSSGQLRRDAAGADPGDVPALLRADAGRAGFGEALSAAVMSAYVPRVATPTTFHLAPHLTYFTLVFGFLVFSSWVAAGSRDARRAGRAGGLRLSATSGSYRSPAERVRRRLVRRLLAVPPALPRADRYRAAHCCSAQRGWRSMGPRLTRRPRPAMPRKISACSAARRAVPGRRSCSSSSWIRRQPLITTFIGQRAMYDLRMGSSRICSGSSVASSTAIRSAG